MNRVPFHNPRLGAEVPQSPVSKRGDNAVREENSSETTFGSKTYEFELAVRVLLERGETVEAFRIIAQVLELEPAARFSEGWQRLSDYQAWPDAWLIAAITRDSPDKAALNALAARYWKLLYGHCRLLTCEPHSAKDLAQTAWCRILRARTSLKSDGNFAAYISVVATNIWRDLHRASLRAGTMAVDRLVSLDAMVTTGGSSEQSLAELVPDLEAVHTREREEVMHELYAALERLNPVLRDVVVARFITGESCAEIGRRHGRTEQTISAWIRQASKEMRSALQQMSEACPRKEGA